MLTKILNASCVSKGALACRSGCRACGLDWPMMSLEAVLGEMIAAGSLEIGLPKANNPHQKLESKSKEQKSNLTEKDDYCYADQSVAPISTSPNDPSVELLQLVAKPIRFHFAVLLQPEQT